MRFLKPTKETRKAKRYLKRLVALKIFWVFIIFIITVILSPFILFLFLRPEVATNINYGVTFSKKYASELGLDWKDTYKYILDDLGVKHIRLIAYWDDIEKEKDVYNFDDIIWQVEEAEKRNTDIIMTIGRKVPRYPECFEPAWWKKIENETIRDQELYEYIKVSVNTLNKYDSISKWQIENEPFFEFGDCSHKIKYSTVSNEIAVVRELSSKEILVQDSGEGGFWYPSYKLGNYLGISMYRRVWYDFWGIFFSKQIYFRYPLAHWTYKIKSELTRVPYQKMIVTELQAEPWGSNINSSLTQEQKDKTMSRHHFFETISYAQKTGFGNFYLWGVEWWYWEKEMNSNPFFWNTAKVLFN